MNDTETDPETGITRTEDAVGAGAGTGIGGTKTVIETGSHRGGNTAVGVGMGNGTTSGRASWLVLA